MEKELKDIDECWSKLKEIRKEQRIIYGDIVKYSRKIDGIINELSNIRDWTSIPSIRIKEYKLLHELKETTNKFLTFENKRMKFICKEQEVIYLMRIYSTEKYK